MNRFVFFLSFLSPLYTPLLYTLEFVANHSHLIDYDIDLLSMYTSAGSKAICAMPCASVHFGGVAMIVAPPLC